MSILVGMLYLECDTFNTEMVKKEAFNYVQGEASLSYLHVSDIFAKAGFDVIPTFIASALPGGIMNEDDFWFFANQFFKTAQNEKDRIDGIFLHLHGSMEVENIGSGELIIAQRLREIVGNKIPMAFTLDAHANNVTQLCDYVDFIRGYHTIPHCDQAETEMKTAAELITLIKKGKRTRTALFTLPMILVGEKALTGVEPLKTLMDKVAQIENMPEIAECSIYIGDSWSDTPNTHLSVSITPRDLSDYGLALETGGKLARMVFEARERFDFEIDVMTPEDAITAALIDKGKCIFISDTGDNTTGGAVGDSTEMLRRLIGQDTKGKRILITTIRDYDSYKILEKKQIGEDVSISVGRNTNSTNKGVEISGKIISKGLVLGYLNCEEDSAGHCVTVRCGNIDVMISDVAGSFISKKHFDAANTPLEDYSISVLKQGYLFSQLRPYADSFYMAITDGTSYHFIERLQYNNIQRPTFPFEL